MRVILRKSLLYALFFIPFALLPGGQAWGQITQFSNFAGVPDNGIAIPPDTNGAVGPTKIMVTHNSEVRFQTRAGVFISSKSLDAFWGSVLPAGSITTDPHVAYDEDSGRFIMTTITFNPSFVVGPYYTILIGASATSDPTGAWYQYAVQADANNNVLPDYPSLGFNHSWIVVTANMYPVPSLLFRNVNMYVFQKSQVIANQSLTVVKNPPGFDNSGFTIQPAVTFSTAPDLYMVDNQVDTNDLPLNFLRISKLTGPVASPTWQTAGSQGGLLATIPHNIQRNPDQQGTTAEVDDGDTRIGGNVLYRNGKIWTTHAGSIVPTQISTSGVFWYEIDPNPSGDPFIVQKGSIADPSGGTYYFYPSIAVDDLNNVAMGFSASSNGMYVSGFYAGRRFSDPPNAMSAPVLFRAGVAPYAKDFGHGDIRWGDFSATMNDPANPGGFWTIQEFSSATPNGRGCTDPLGCWGTHWANFTLDAAIAGAPSGFAASTLGTSSITWTWAPVAGAHTYNVYYATNPASLITNVSTISFTFSGLLANTTYAISVKGVNLVSQGPAGVSQATSTLAVPLAGGTLGVWISSIAATYTPLPASPQSASSFGYSLQASTAPDFSGVTYSSNTGSVGQSSLTLSGLQAYTTYFLRLGTLNQTGGADFISLGTTLTLTSLVPPGALPFTNVSSFSVQANWTLSTNPPGLQYFLETSTAPDYSGTVISTLTFALSAALNPLQSNTTYFFSVKATTGPFGSLGSTVTLAAVPGVASPAFSNVALTSMTALWASGGNSPGTLYHVDYSSSPTFAFNVTSSNTVATSLVMTGLDPNSTYYFRVSAFNYAGAQTAFAPTQGLSSLSQPPAGVPNPYVTTQSSITVSWVPRPVSPQSAACEGYRVDASTLADFSGVLQSSQTFDPTVSQLTVGGLLGSTTYFVRVGALNWNAAPDFLILPGTPTLANVPGVASPSFSNIALSSMTALWTTAGNPPGVIYHVDYSSVASFASNITSSNTVGTSLTMTGLLTNTTYFFRVAAINFGGVQSAFQSPQSTSSLTNPPSAVPNPFLTVTSSITVAWGPLPLSPQTATCEGYRVDASSASDFSGIIFSNSTPDPSASALAVKGSFLPQTTYYVRVGALNWNGTPDYVVLGSSETPPYVVSSMTITNQGVLTLTITSVPCPLTSITVSIPPNTFPTGTLVTADASFFTVVLPNSSSSEGQITPLGTDIGVALSAQGAQPQLPVSIQMGYNPACLAAGTNPSNLVMARYVDDQGQWTFLPTTVDTRGQTIFAQTTHFSLFSPFFVTAGTSLDSVAIFPIPWEIGSGDPNFDALNLTFSNLPLNSTIKLYTILGEQVWHASTPATGVVLWDGRNSHGFKVGSGTYLAVITSPDNRTLVRKVTVVR